MGFENINMRTFIFLLLIVFSSVFGQDLRYSSVFTISKKYCASNCPGYQQPGNGAGHAEVIWKTNFIAVDNAEQCTVSTIYIHNNVESKCIK